MSPKGGSGRLAARVSAALAAAVAIALVDNVAFGGEVSPIVVVAALLVATFLFGLLWGRGGALATAIVWVTVPMVHVVKRVVGLPDTLHPGTWRSILLLALFTLAVSAVGYGAGSLLRVLLAPDASQSVARNGVEHRDQ